MNNLILLIFVCFISSCAGPNAFQARAPEADFLRMEERKFTSPGDGKIFQLTLGKQLDSNDRGVTPVPDGIIGNRSATASYYSIKDKRGLLYGKAESSIAEEFEHLIKFIEIQYERSSGRILVTEDTSDALPNKRYILFTPTNFGYSVDYLAPAYEINMGESGVPFPPPEIILLPEDKVWVGGEILSISDIPKYKQPFSLGG